ncbi:hypothetical protein F4802DRAFT_269237 [Xylaria palmicola]|nr:hypothetical protein F4802DRAFT_269237 [Xylaria palmicola]
MTGSFLSRRLAIFLRVLQGLVGRCFWLAGSLLFQPSPGGLSRGNLNTGLFLHTELARPVRPDHAPWQEYQPLHAYVRGGPVSGRSDLMRWNTSLGIQQWTHHESVHTACCADATRY